MALRKTLLNNSTMKQESCMVRKAIVKLRWAIIYLALYSTDCPAKTNKHGLTPLSNSKVIGTNCKPNHWRPTTVINEREKPKGKHSLEFTVRFFVKIWQPATNDVFTLMYYLHKAVIRSPFILEKCHTGMTQARVSRCVYTFRMS